jgi:hypothetical protein
MENIRGKPGKSYRARNGACVRLPVCLFTWATQGIADSVARYCGAFRGRFGSAPRYPDHGLSPPFFHRQARIVAEIYSRGAYCREALHIRERYLRMIAVAMINLLFIS